MGRPNPSASAASDVESVDWNDPPTEVPRQPSPEPASIFARHSSEAWDHIVRFYCTRLERGEVDRTLEHLHRFIFSRVRKDIPEDVRQRGRSQPPTAGSAPQPAASSVQVVASFEYTAQRLMAVLDTRDTYLRWSGLVETTVMTDEQRKEFIHWVRSEYEEEPLQQDLQTRVWNEGGNKQFREGKRKRWHRELQRRLGSKQLWEIVSFQVVLTLTGLSARLQMRRRTTAVLPTIWKTPSGSESKAALQRTNCVMPRTRRGSASVTAQFLCGQASHRIRR